MFYGFVCYWIVVVVVAVVHFNSLLVFSSLSLSLLLCYFREFCIIIHAVIMVWCHIQFLSVFSVSHMVCLFDHSFVRVWMYVIEYRIVCLQKCVALIKCARRRHMLKGPPKKNTTFENDNKFIPHISTTLTLHSLTHKIHNIHDLRLWQFKSMWIKKTECVFSCWNGVSISGQSI